MPGAPGCSASAAGILLALAATLTAPDIGRAARLTDVRVGRHPGFTRVVLELDAPAPYRLEEPLVGRAPELRVLVAAESEAWALAPAAPLVRSVRVEPAQLGAAVRIELVTAAVRVEELILAGPPRIVLDLRRAPRPAAPQPVTEPPEPPRPSEAPSGTLEPAPSIAPPEVAAPAPAEVAETPAVTPRTEPAATPYEEPAETPGEEPAATPREQPVPPPRATPVEVAPPATPAARAARMGDRAWGVGRIGGLVVLAAAVLLLAFASWWRLRRRPTARERIAPQREEAREAAAPPPERAPEPPWTERHPPPDEVGRRFEEVAQRLARLDARLDEFRDAHERLARTLEAQGEELRVQRAAIARLQRLSRFLVRREERGEEGLHRSPWS